MSDETMQAAVEELQALREGFSTAVGNESFSQLPAKLLSGMSKAFAFMTTWDYTKPRPLQSNLIRGLLRSANYADLLDISVTKPMGLKGPLKPYLEFHEKETQVFMRALVSKILNPYAIWAGQYLKDPTLLTKVGVPAVPRGWDAKSLEKLKGGIGEYIESGSRESSTTYGEIYSSNQDVLDTMEATNIVNFNIWKDAAPDKVKKVAQGYESTIAALLDKINTGEVTPNKQHVRALTDATTFMAQTLELYAVINTLMIDLSEAQRANEGILRRELS